MYYLKIVFLLLMLKISIICFCRSMNRTNKLGIMEFSSSAFGPYFVTTEKLEKCPNPKRIIDKNHFSPITIAVRKINRTKEEFTGYVYIPNNLQYHEANIQINHWRDGGFRQVYDTIIKKPCSDIFMSTLMNFLKPDKNCIAKKGNYTFSITKDLNDLVHLLVGENFFYSRLSFRSELYTKIGTVFCIDVYCQTKSLRNSNKTKRKQ